MQILIIKTCKSEFLTTKVRRSILGDVGVALIQEPWLRHEAEMGLQGYNLLVSSVPDPARTCILYL